MKTSSNRKNKEHLRDIQKLCIMRYSVKNETQNKIIIENNFLTKPNRTRTITFCKNNF